MSERPFDQYNSAEKAAVYADIDVFPVRVYAEEPTVFEALGELHDAEVMDVACGTGMYTRLLASRGARKVLGVDAAPAMIEQAREETDPATGNIEYMQCDVSKLPKIGQFDAVLAAFLLNYAEDYSELVGMCSNIRHNLRPGGHFVASIPYSRYDPTHSWGDRYGITPHLPNGVSDGDEYTFDIHFQEMITVAARWWKIETYQRAMEEAGFADITIRPWEPNDEGIQRMGKQWWEPWRDNPFNAIISGSRPTAS